MPLLLILLIIINLFLPLEVAAFWKKKAPKELILNQNIIVGGKFQAKNRSNNEIYELRLAIQDHPVQKLITVVSLYDETTINPIEDIVWINQENIKKSENRIKAIKVESMVNRDLEAAAAETNPTLAYDRMHSNQHVISKVFFYDRDAILPIKNKMFVHKLELYMPNSRSNQYKIIQVDKFLYKLPEQEPKLEAVDPYKKPFWWQRDGEKQKEAEPTRREETSVQSSIVLPPVQAIPSQEEQDLREMQEAAMQIRNPEYNYDSMPPMQEPNALQPVQQMMKQGVDPREFMMQQQMMQMNALYGSEDSEDSPADELF